MKSKIKNLLRQVSFNKLAASDSEKAANPVTASLASALSSLALPIAATVYAKNTLPKVYQDKELTEALWNAAKEDKIGRLSMEKARNPKLEAMVMNNPAFAVTGKTRNGKHPVAINVSKELKDRPGILAHELGHAKYQLKSNLGKKLTIGGNVLALGGLTVGANSPLFIQDKDTAKNIALLSSAATLPQLGTELHASYKGMQLMNQLAKSKNKKLSLLAKLSPFVGVPTYAATTTVPLAAYKIKDILGGYNKTASEQINPSLGDKMKRDWSKEYEDLKKEDARATWLDPVQTTALTGLGATAGWKALSKSNNKWLKALSALAGATALGGLSSGYNRVVDSRRKDDLEKLKDLDKYQRIRDIFNLKD